MPGDSKSGQRTQATESASEAAPPAEPGPPAMGPPGSPSADMATDRWFRQQLRRLYDDVASEPVPQEFLDILNRIKSPPGGSEGAE